MLSESQLRAVALTNQRRAERDARQTLFKEEASLGDSLPPARRCELENLAVEMELVQAQLALALAEEADAEKDKTRWRHDALHRGSGGEPPMGLADEIKAKRAAAETQRRADAAANAAQPTEQPHKEIVEEAGPGDDAVPRALFESGSSSAEVEAWYKEQALSEHALRVTAHGQGEEAAQAQRELQERHRAGMDRLRRDAAVQYESKLDDIRAEAMEQWGGT